MLVGVITEYPELEGNHKDCFLDPTRIQQKRKKWEETICLRAFRYFSSSVSLVAVTTALGCLLWFSALVSPRSFLWVCTWEGCSCLSILRWDLNPKFMKRVQFRDLVITMLISLAYQLETQTKASQRHFHSLVWLCVAKASVSEPQS